MTFKKRTLTLTALTAIAALALVPLASRADDDDDDEEEEHEHHGRRGRSAQVLTGPQWQQYQAECGSCHLAYPPNLLPAPSWRKVMGGLADHFGQNAEVDAETQQQLTSYLTQNARADRGEQPLRITEMAFWRHEHRELSSAVWQRKAVGSRANCQACHPNADQGDFEEHGVKIPRDENPPR